MMFFLNEKEVELIMEQVYLCEENPNLPPEVWELIGMLRFKIQTDDNYNKKGGDV